MKTMQSKFPSVENAEIVKQNHRHPARFGVATRVMEMLVALFATTAVAASAVISVPVSNPAYDGYGYGNVPDAGTWATNTGTFLTTGDTFASNNVVYQVSIVKFDLRPFKTTLAGKTILDATVNMTTSTTMPWAAYILLQKFTYDNGKLTFADKADCADSRVQNVSISTVAANSTGSATTWAVTSLVQADLTAGWDFSSYRFVSVVSATDPTPYVPTGTSYIKFASVEAGGSVVPRLDITIPEPTALGLLLAGCCSLLLKRHKGATICKNSGTKGNK